MTTNRQKRQGINLFLAILLAALFITACSHILPDTAPTLSETVSTSANDVEEEDDEEEAEGLTTEEVTATVSVEDETEEATEQTYAIADGYIRVNQIVEAKVNINLRSGPGTEYESYGLLIAQEQIERISISDDGTWSQVIYDGTVCYAASDYLLVVEDDVVITMPADEAETTEESDDAQDEACELESKSMDELAAISNETIPYGYGTSVDEQNRPTGVLYYESLYGDYGVDFIGPSTENLVYLTIDEGYEAGYTPTILDILKEKDVKAVFFVTKQFVTENPDLVQRIIDEGHQLGNHSSSHPSAGMPSLGLEEEYEDISWVHDYVLEEFGYEMTLFRYPAGIFSEQSLALINSMGYHAVFWSYAHRDWIVDDQPDEETALQDCLDSLHPGEIFLLHGVSSTNTNILADLIDGVREAGYEFGVYPSHGF